MLKVGTLAPQLQEKDQNGQPISLQVMCKDAPVVVFFYPKDFTPVCTRQACGFRDLAQELAKARVQVIGISHDDAQSHQRFAAEHALPYSLISDPDRHIARTFDALWFGRFPKRVTYVVDTQGMIRAAIHSELSADQHLAQVRSALSDLGSKDA